MLHCYVVTMLLCYVVTLLHYYVVTLLRCYIVTLLRCYIVALLHCYIVALLHCCSAMQCAYIRRIRSIVEKTHLRITHCYTTGSVDPVPQKINRSFPYKRYFIPEALGFWGHFWQQFFLGSLLCHENSTEFFFLHKRFRNFLT